MLVTTRVLGHRQTTSQRTPSRRRLPRPPPPAASAPQRQVLPHQLRHGGAQPLRGIRREKGEEDPPTKRKGDKPYRSNLGSAVLSLQSGQPVGRQPRRRGLLDGTGVPPRRPRHGDKSYHSNLGVAVLSLHVVPPRGLLAKARQGDKSDCPN